MGRSRRRRGRGLPRLSSNQRSFALHATHPHITFFHKMSPTFSTEARHPSGSHAVCGCSELCWWLLWHSTRCRCAMTTCCSRRRQVGGSGSRARHGDAPLPRIPEGQRDIDQLHRVDLRLGARPCPSRQARQQSGLGKFSSTLEKVCIDTVESGFMTKDLALFFGPDQKRPDQRALQGRTTCLKHMRFLPQRVKR